MNADSLLYTSIDDAKSSLECARMNGQPVPDDVLKEAITAEERRAQPRKGLITLLNRELRRNGGRQS